jgi:Arylsulfotransferase (ASST)
MLLSFAAVPVAAHGHDGRDAVRLSTEPALFPDFSPDIHDYVTRCTDGVPLQVTVAASRRGMASVDDGPMRRGSFAQPVSVTAGQSFSVRVLRHGTGLESYYVRCLPQDFPTFTAQRVPGRPQAQWYIAAPFSGAIPASTSLHYVGIFDTNGVPVWWYRASTPALDAKLLADGDIAWLQFNPGGRGAGQAEEHSLDGPIVRSIAAVGSGTDSHEIQRLSNGSYLVARYYVRSPVDLTACGGASDASVVDNELQEVGADGAVMWSWSVMDHIPPSEVTARWRDECAVSGPADIYHFNSAQEDGGGFVLSFRHLEAVLRIDKPTGAIDWKLGGTPRPESLRPVGDQLLASAGFGGQHDARVLGDGTLTVLDNGTRAARAPRAVRYRIDPRSKTATLLEHVTDAAVVDSFCCGSARRLAGGNWVTSWGGRPFVTELDAAGTPVFRLTFTQGLFSYRADALPFGRLSARTLRRAMDAQYPRSGDRAVGLPLHP